MYLSAKIAFQVNERRVGQLLVMTVWGGDIQLHVQRVVPNVHRESSHLPGLQTHLQAQMHCHVIRVLSDAPVVVRMRSVIVVRIEDFLPTAVRAWM
jgi:hypothetical protein